ncbi:hypothetical protein F7734_16290 [Scytonema sp. UIC 10036]|uniref:GAF domain-containing protein n=1 Tax=Scytonema sp. UIC 10036 TaxID=2304196 RepID=UPI0012DACDAF|nr:GAF domain-containing protein [Scytonema sp. UIC 10036]MUG93882.1 hypothetical protein [Scytonema sp. UIC 10036]
MGLTFLNCDSNNSTFSLYLENNLTTGVFTSDRLQVLKLLIAQAAISLENARLYERLADYSEILERKVDGCLSANQL